MRNFLLIATLVSIHTTLSAGIFSWTDASGNVVYGDSPPDTVVAETVDPPKLTILEGFAGRYESPNKPSSRTESNNAVRNSIGPAAPSNATEVKNPYKTLSIIAPKAGQSIRANDGDVSVAMSTSPKLRVGDKVVIYLNNQEHSKVEARVANLSNLGRGEYQLSIEIQNGQGESLIKSDNISFNVIRNSVITNKNKPYNPYEADPSQ